MIFLVKEFGRQLASKMPKAKAIKTNQLVRWYFENTLKTQHCSANACKTQPCTCLIEDQSCSLENLSLDCHLSDFSSFQFVDVFWMNNPTQLMISSGSSNASRKPWQPGTDHRNVEASGRRNPAIHGASSRCNRNKRVFFSKVKEASHDTAS